MPEEPRRLTREELLAQRQAEAQALDDEGKGFRPIDDIRKNAEPLEPVWGDWLFRKTVTMIVGDPGVCKTTMGYALGTALCRGEKFLGVHADCNVCIAYLDFESSDSLISQRADLIDPDAQVIPHFDIWNEGEFSLPELAPVIVARAQTHGYNIIIIDNQSTAFSTFDENDNAEAFKQIKIIRQLANDANAAVILYHHPSKMLSAVVDPNIMLPGLNKGSGAGSRARLVDIIYNLNRTPSPDLVQLECAKDRLLGKTGEVRYIQRTITTEKDISRATFDLLDTLPPGMLLEFTPADKPRELAEKEIQQLLLTVDSMSNADIITSIRREGISTSTINKALMTLKRSGRVLANYKGMYGHYASRARIELLKYEQKRQKELAEAHNNRKNGASNEDLPD